MARTYSIRFLIEDAMAQAAVKRSIAGLEAIEKAATRVAKSAQTTHANNAAAAQKSSTTQARDAQRLDAIQDRYLKADYSRRVQYERRKEQDAAKTAATQAREAAKASTAQAREAAKLDTVQDRIVQQDYRRRVQFERRKEQEAARQSAREDRMRTKALSEEEIALRVRNAHIEQHNQKRVDAAMKAAGIEKQSYGEVTTEALKNFALQAVGIGGLVGLMQTFGQAATDAGERSRQLASKFASQRDQLGELGTLMGRPADNGLAADIAGFGVKTGMGSSERNAFLTELYNSGAQFKGNKISNQEFDQFAEQAGSLTTALGFDPAQTGNLAGTVLGFSDYSKHGDKASEQALGKLNSGLAILGHGKGRASVMANQFSMLTSASLNEDEMRGTFTDSDEAAIALSIGAEKHDASAAEMVKIATRGLRGFGKNQGPMLKKAGITPETGFIAAIEQLAPVVDAEAKRRNLKTEDVLRETFKDEEVTNSIATFINKGVSGGGFAERRQFAKGVRGPEAALGTIGEFQKGEKFLSRQADALVDQAELERGAENSKLDIIRRQAIASLTAKKEIDTTSSNFKDYLVGNTSFGLLGTGEQLRIDTEAQRLIQATTPAGAAKGSMMDMLNFTPTAREEDLNRQIQRSEAAGGNPLAAVVKLLEEQNKLMREERERSKGGPSPARKAPAPLPGAPQAGAMRP